MSKDSKFLEKIMSDKNCICSMQIVFVDIVKYSQRKTKRQVELIDQFTKIIDSAINETAKFYYNQLSLNEIILKRDIVILPTGDGVAISLPFDWIDDVHLTLSIQILNKIEELNNLSKCQTFLERNWCDCHNLLKVRIGISEGKLVLYKDINGDYNVAGNPINMASRVMNFANPNQIIFTEEAFNQYESFNYLQDTGVSFKQYKNVEIKHGTRINVYQYRNNNLKSLNSDSNDILTDNVDEEIITKVQKEESTKSVVEKKVPEKEIGLIDLITVDVGSYNRISDKKQINVLKPFAISKYLITQSLYSDIIGKNPSINKGKDFPVENVSFIEAIDFCNSLSIKEGYEEVYVKTDTNKVKWNEGVKGYRLPFENEWEFVLRYDLEKIKTDLNSIAWYHNNSDNQTHAVGLKSGNILDIHDLLGNVWEWCFDSYLANPFYTVSNIFYNNEDSAFKVVRGGSFADFESLFTAQGFRKKSNQESRSKSLGFRIVFQKI